MNPLVGTGFDQYIGTRTKPGQTAVEFYNTQNSSTPAFASPKELAYFAGTISGRSDINEQNVFDILKQGFTPRAQALDQVKSELNTFQNNTFSEQTAPKRQSSSLTEKIAVEDTTISEALNEFATLKTKLTGLQAPNYQQSYNDLRTAQGVPQLEQDFLGLRQQRRELPYRERAATGNAGVATEGQLRAQTAEKDIPLEIQEANLIDRLQLASDFVNNSIKLREQDHKTAKEGLATAIDLVTKTLDMSRQRVADLYQQYQDGLTLARELGVSSRFYTKPGSPLVYDGITHEELNYEEYKKRGGTGVLGQPFPDVQELAPKGEKGVELSPGNTLVDPYTGRVLYQAPARATGGGGRGGGGIAPEGDDPQLYAGLSSATATAVRAQVNAFKSEPTVQNFAVIQEGHDFAASLSNTTKNPADDQALIYALAKALDPGSVVREGEYATAQKYSQSWISAYGKGVSQAINGTGFLSEEARRNIKETIKQKYLASKKSYDNLYNQYLTGIGKLTGRGDGTSFLRDYSTQSAFVGPVNPANPQPNKAPAQTPPIQEQGFWKKTINWLFGD
jgi:hypothetical protein